RVAVSQHATPAQVEDKKRRVELLKVEIDIAQREADGRYGGGAKIEKLQEALAAATVEYDAATAKWDREKAALEKAKAARAAFQAARGGGSSPEAQAALPGDEGQGAGGFAGGSADESAAAAPKLSLAEAEAALDAALAEMREAQGDSPMVFAEVDADAVAAVVGDWTGIPIGRMVKDEIASVLTIASQLKKRVVGQDHAMDAVAKRIQTSRAKLDNPNKPVGVFMLAGPSGVGKTETAHVLSELLYSGDDSMIVINMSEFQEAHTVSTLKGAPAGYVGYGQGGVLTEAVRRRPYSVVLLDEVEKAHPDVHEMFFQVFDKGYMDDAEGRY